MSKEELLMREALNKWGFDDQKWQAVEEMAELILAICHHRRGRVPNIDVVEELADSDLMNKQMRIIFDTNNDFEVIQARKLERLERLLRGSK